MELVARGTRLVIGGRNFQSHWTLGWGGAGDGVPSLASDPVDLACVLQLHESPEGWVQSFQAGEHVGLWRALCAQRIEARACTTPHSGSTHWLLIQILINW